MKAEGLRAARELRLLAVEEAGRDLASRIAEEMRAGTAARELAREMERQRLAAEATAEDHDVEAFAAWLRAALARLAALSAAAARAEAETARARASLATARADLEAIDILQRNAEAARRARVAREEQRRLDEILTRGRHEPSSD